MCGGQRNSCWGQFSLSTSWGLGIKFSLLGSILTHRALTGALEHYCIVILASFSLFLASRSRYESIIVWDKAVIVFIYFCILGTQKELGESVKRGL